MPYQVPTDKQLEIAKRLFPAETPISLVEHPDDSKLKALSIDAFTIWSCEIERPLKPDIRKPRAKPKNVKVPGYHVDLTTYVPGTRAGPPDAVVDDIADFECFFDALARVAAMLIENEVYIARDNYGLDLDDEDN